MSLNKIRILISSFLRLAFSKNEGARWWFQRVVSVILVPVVLWFLVSMVHVVGASESEARAWIATPHISFLLIFLLVTIFFHLNHGLHEIIQDYVHNKFWHKLSAGIVGFICYALPIGGIVSVATIFFSA